MRSLRLLSFPFFAFLILTGCKKENLTPNGYTAGSRESASVRVVTSPWAVESSLIWTEATDNEAPSLQSNWVAPQLTQELIDNGAVLIYARRTDDGSVSSLPSAFTNSDNSVYNEYRHLLQEGSVQLTRKTYENGQYVVPAVNDDVRFRYILFENATLTNNRLTANGVEYDFEQLKHMPYEEVAAALGLTD